MLSLNTTLNANRGMMIEPTKANAFFRRAASLAEPQNSNLLAMLMGEEPKPQTIGNVAVIPLKGVIGYDLSPMDKALGMVDLKDFNAQFQAALADPAIKSILIDADTPGGYTVGVEETAAMVKNSTKPVETFGANINSAGLWIGGMASRVWGMASGTYGSIGAIASVEDYSKAFADAGIKVHVISSGWAKGIGWEGAEITNEQLDFLKADIMENAQVFKNDLKSVRKSIPEEAMNGQWFSGRKAAALGIITGIAPNIESVLNRLNS